jgi:hypothetical protein
MVKKPVFIGIASLVMVGLTVPAHGADGTGATPNISVTYNMPAVPFDGPDCVETPINITYTKTGAAVDDISATVSFDARYQGSSSSFSRSVYIGYSTPGTGTVSDSYLYVCPFAINDNAGPIGVTGTVESEVFLRPEITAPLSASVLAVAQNPTKLSKPKVKTVSGFVSYREVTGKATATTLTKGAIGAGGKLSLLVKKKGAKNYSEVSSTSADEFGNFKFSYVSTKKFPKGSSYKVTVSECGWCTTAQVTGKIQ